jgi:hypothetical protein
MSTVEIMESDEMESLVSTQASLRPQMRIPLATLDIFTTAIHYNRVDQELRQQILSFRPSKLRRSGHVIPLRWGSITTTALTTASSAGRDLLRAHELPSQLVAASLCGLMT